MLQALLALPSTSIKEGLNVDGATRSDLQQAVASLEVQLIYREGVGTSVPPVHPPTNKPSSNPPGNCKLRGDKSWYHFF